MIKTRLPSPDRALHLQRARLASHPLGEVAPRGYPAVIAARRERREAFSKEQLPVLIRDAMLPYTGFVALHWNGPPDRRVWAVGSGSTPSPIQESGARTEKSFEKVVDTKDNSLPAVPDRLAPPAGIDPVFKGDLLEGWSCRPVASPQRIGTLALREDFDTDEVYCFRGEVVIGVPEVRLPRSLDESSAFDGNPLCPLGAE